MSSGPDTVRVLHVDDDAEFAELTASFLEREHDRLSVETATTAAGTQRLADPDADIDCVVSDYDMPETNGIEFLESVRNGWPDLPFILFTGKGSEEIASDAISAGALEDGFYVEDDGPGVPEAERGDVFDAGYSTAADGTGFGLNIAERVSEAHGWEIRLTDGSDGGARFEVTGVEFVAG